MQQYQPRVGQQLSRCHPCLLRPQLGADVVSGVGLRLGARGSHAHDHDVCQRCLHRLLFFFFFCSSQVAGGSAARRSPCRSHQLRAREPTRPDAPRTARMSSRESTHGGIDRKTPVAEARRRRGEEKEGAAVWEEAVLHQPQGRQAGGGDPPATFPRRGCHPPPAERGGPPRTCQRSPVPGAWGGGGGGGAGAATIRGYPAGAPPPPTRRRQPQTPPPHPLHGERRGGRRCDHCPYTTGGVGGPTSGEGWG